MLVLNATLKIGGVAGYGNIVVDSVAKRFVALAEGNTAVIFNCGVRDADTDEIRRSDILPWISGYFPARGSVPALWDNTTTEFPFPPAEYCPSHSLPLKFMIPLIGHDLRRMAIALVGSGGVTLAGKDRNPRAVSFEKEHLVPEARKPPYAPVDATGTIYWVPIHGYFENGPLFDGIVLDDVVIHYRCGDILLPGAPGPFYFPKYDSYTKLISPEAKSVGIITQPFSTADTSAQFRKRDQIDESGARCRVLVEGLVDYIYEHCPNIAAAAKAKATGGDGDEQHGGVTIHNGPNETVALAYARMIMANQSLLLFPSTFTSMPALSGFGTAYVTKPTKDVKGSFANAWLRNPMIENIYPNQPVEVPIYPTMLYANHLKTFWQYGTEFVLEWFRDPSIPPGLREPPPTTGENLTTTGGGLRR